jgi:glycosyltransferase involved in cell wall biosynthesis
LARHFVIDIVSGSIEINSQVTNIRSISELNVSKDEFRFNKQLRQLIKERNSIYDFIMVPYEKKFLLLLIYVKIQKLRYKRNFMIFSHNHPVAKSRFGSRFLTRFVYKFFYDKIIFYTQDSYKWAISERLIKPKRAAWANNTIDETEIINLREDRQIPLSPPRLLMIGRLLEYRWIDRLLDYYAELKKSVPTVELHVIGDGPEKFKIEKAQKSLSDVHYYGMLIDEPKIAQIINRVDFVFIPGHSGLSINHAFSYGKPYITSRDYTNHPPEYSYLKDGINSIILSGSRSHDIEKLKHYITDKEKYDNLRAGAIDAAEKMSIRNWVKQMKFAIEA